MAKANLNYEIVKGNNLMLPEKEQRPYHHYKTLEDLGLKALEFYRKTLDLSKDGFDALLERVKNFLGSEYISISEELQKYMKAGREPKSNHRDKDVNVRYG